MITPNRPQTTAAVAAHYDELDTFYRDIWGEHVHHGFWETGGETPHQAVEALVERLASRLSLAPGHQVCDIGCGYGATAALLTQRHAVAVTGVTVSARQAERAPAGVSVRLRDWLNNDFPNAHFDRAYAIESSEHMPDKQRFFDEAFRTLKPGGLLGIYAWLASDTPPPWQQRFLLEPICREGRLPGLGTQRDYSDLAARSGFEAVSVEDISDQVRRTWSICLSRGLRALLTQPRYLRFLLRPGQGNRVFALTIPRIMLAYRTHAMRYCLFVFRRP